MEKWKIYLFMIFFFKKRKNKFLMEIWKIKYKTIKIKTCNNISNE